MRIILLEIKCRGLAMSIRGPFVSYSYITVLSSNSDISVYSTVSMLEKNKEAQVRQVRRYAHTFSPGGFVQPKTIKN